MSEELKPGAETTPDVLENAMTEATETRSRMLRLSRKSKMNRLQTILT